VAGETFGNMDAVDREDQEAPATTKETAGLLDGSGDASSRRSVEAIEIDSFFDDDDDTRTHAVPSLADRIQERLLLKPRLTLATVFFGIVSVYFISGGAFSKSKGTRRSWIKVHRGSHEGSPSYPVFPARQLLGIGNNSTSSPYNTDDFENGQNGTVRYWRGVQAAIEKSQSTPTSNVWNLSTWGPCYPRANTRQTRGTRGSHELSNWTSIVRTTSLEKIAYPVHRKTLEGLCRPGYLLIGQGEGKVPACHRAKMHKDLTRLHPLFTKKGKCGTSSFYHYIAGHPRVLEAKKKQIVC